MTPAMTPLSPDWPAGPFLIVGGSGIGLILISTLLIALALGSADPAWNRWASRVEPGVWVGAFFVVVAALAATLVALEGP